MSYQRSNGYVYCLVDGTEWLEHRYIWVCANGKIPHGMEIDHIDQDKTNNMIENLRLVTKCENQKNRPRQKNNSSGCTGVTWSESRQKWIAQIQVNKKSINLGGFIDIKDAIKCRKEEEMKYKFHKNHDKADFKGCKNELLG